MLNVRDFGAVGDGISNDTFAVQKAINEASESGRILHFPAGEYRVSTIFLKSNLTIELSVKAKILGSQNISDYCNEIIGCVEAPSFNNCLIYAEGQSNIAFIGTGVIDGCGGVFQETRPMLMRFINCNNIKFKDITFKDSGSWCCHMIECTDIMIDGIHLYNQVQPNNDGFDFDGCVDVLVVNSKIISRDDSICLKSTTGRQCKNFVISNCVISSHTAAIKLGTSSKSGFCNIAISNCAFYDCVMGTIKLLCVDGGSLENITINNIAMHNVASPLFIRLGKRNLTFDQPREMDFVGNSTEAKTSDKIGILRNIIVSNITADVTVQEKARRPIMISGLSDRIIENVELNNISIRYIGGGTEEDAERIIPEDPYKYPEQYFFGVLPAYGLYACNVKGLALNNVSLTLMGEDKREAIKLINVELKTN